MEYLVLLVLGIAGGIVGTIFVQKKLAEKGDKRNALQKAADAVKKHFG